MNCITAFLSVVHHERIPALSNMVLNDGANRDRERVDRSTAGAERIRYRFLLGQSRSRRYARRHSSGPGISRQPCGRSAGFGVQRARASG